MTIPPAERDKMLAVALCGPRVLARLERVGIQRLDDLADRDPTELVLAVNLSVGRPIWHAPMAERAMSNLMGAALAQRHHPGAHQNQATASRARPEHK